MKTTKLDFSKGDQVKERGVKRNQVKFERKIDFFHLSATRFSIIFVSRKRKNEEKKSKTLNRAKALTAKNKIK
jgi:hypothetical protein